MSDDFPAPEGPIIAVSWPDLKSPDTPFRIVFVSKTKKYENLGNFAYEFVPVSEIDLSKKLSMSVVYCTGLYFIK